MARGQAPYKGKDHIHKPKKGKADMNATKSLAIILLLTLSTTAMADNTLRLEFGGWSSHASLLSDGITNESHDIIAADWKGVAVGRFNNSFGRETWFIAKTWRSSNVFGVDNLDAVASLGLNKGYRGCYRDSDDSGKICPHGYFGFDYSVKRVYISIKTQIAATILSFGVKIF